jgi:PAS domain S-box-containing protein
MRFTAGTQRQGGHVMELTKEQMQLLIDCAAEPTVLYLFTDEKTPVVPLLYTADVPAFSGLTDAEYRELYAKDAAKAVLPQDLPALMNSIRRITEQNGVTCTYRTYHKTKGNVWTHAALKWIGEYEGRQVLLGVFSNVSDQVAENTPGGFFIYAAQEDDQFFFVGENMLEMLGYTRSEFHKKFQNRFRYMVYEEDREATLKSIENQIAENGHYDKVDYRIEKKDGSLLWVHDEGHYIVDKDSRPWFYVTINDMNDVFEKNSRLQKENTELSGIIRSIPVGLSVYRLKQSQAELVAINDAACAIFCITQKEIDDGSQTAFSARVHPEDLGAQVVYMREIKHPGRHESMPFRYAAEHGGWKWLRLATETTKAADGALVMYNVITDLTAERQAEEKLERARAVQQEQYQSSLKTLILANPQSLCTVRLNLSRNKCEEWFGTSAFVIRTIQAETAEGVIDNISRIIISDEDRIRFREHFGRDALITAFRSGRRRDTLRYRRVVEDGSSIWVETVVNMVENPESHEIEAVLFSENVTRQVLNEKIIQISNDTGYDYIATLRLPQQLFQFRFLGDTIPGNYREIYKDISRPAPYADIVDYAKRTWVAAEEISHFEKESAVASIIEHLNKTGSYSITIKSKRNDGYGRLETDPPWPGCLRPRTGS